MPFKTLGELMDNLNTDAPSGVSVAITYFPYPQADCWVSNDPLFTPFIERAGCFSKVWTFHSGLFQKLAPIVGAKAGTQAAAIMIGAATEVFSSTNALFLTRALRKARLWPAPGGGARYTSVTASHVTNLCLALMSGTSRGAGRRVRQFRALPVTYHGCFTQRIAA